MNQKYNTENLKEIFAEIHHNFYNYDKMVYNGYKAKVTVTCPEHGDFEIGVSKHLAGQGCPKCRYVKSSAALRRPIETIIEKFKSVHGDEYDYSLITNYKNTNENLPIICRKHGVFYQSYNNHYNGEQGCPVCGRELCAEHQRLTREEFVEKANIVHGGKYDYSLVKYKNVGTKIDIICPKHGVFSQIAANHLMGQGCPLCFKEKSNVEREVFEFITELVGEKNIMANDRKMLDGKEIDIFLPKYGIGFEVNGLIWHSEKFEPNKNAMVDKLNLAESKSIKLINIFEDDWNHRQHIVKSRIRNILGITTNRIYARQCEIREVPYYESKLFLDMNHLQGNCVSKYRYGLYYQNELVSLMTFGKLRKNVNGKVSDGAYELLRFCNRVDCNVIGGASRLFGTFLKEHDPREIISYADRCWSNGNLYETLNFVKYNISKPSYFYIIGKKKINRFNLRKDVLMSQYGCPKEMSEHQFCYSRGWYRIYDCGCLCYEWKKIV